MPVREARKSRRSGLGGRRISWSRSRRPYPSLRVSPRWKPGEVFDFVNKHDIGIKASPHDFLVNNKQALVKKNPKGPQLWQDTLYYPVGKKDAAVFYAWLNDGNRFKLNQMTMEEIRELWKSLGVSYDFH